MKAAGWIVATFGESVFEHPVKYQLCKGQNLFCRRCLMERDAIALRKLEGKNTRRDLKSEAHIAGHRGRHSESQALTCGGATPCGVMQGSLS